MNSEPKPPEMESESYAHIPVLFQLEAENSNLRRLVVELLEKNQLLREQLRVLAKDGDSEMPGDLVALHKVDPRAA